MASFTPPEPPFEPDEPTPPPTLTVPLPPPEVGEGSPWAPADSENRDRILDWWRMWFRRVFFPWVAAFTAYWDAQWNRLATYINTWITAADEYITEHAIAGYSFRLTSTPIAPEGTTNVTITDGLDVEHRPLVVGDLVLDTSEDSNYGVITVVIDDTHATVAYVGSLKGQTGHGWWSTVTPIAAEGPTNVVLSAESDRVPQVNDFVIDETSSLRYGIVTAVIDATHVTVSPLGVLRGLNGYSWWTTGSTIIHAGTTDVVLPADATRTPQVNDLVVDGSVSVAFGIITVVIDATHVTVEFIRTLQGPAGGGGGGGVNSVSGSTFIFVDNTDPANPVVEATGLVFALVAGTGISINNDDPEHPIITALANGIDSIVAGSGIHVDNTDPFNPIVSTTGGGGGGVTSIVAGSHITVDNTDPANPVVAAVVPVTAISGGPGIGISTSGTNVTVDNNGVITASAGTGISIDDTDPQNIIITNDGSGGGIVQTIQNTDDTISIDNSDPANPIIGTIGLGPGLVETIVAGAGISVDSTDPFNPIVTNTDAGGAVQSVTAADASINVFNTDPQNPTIGIGIVTAISNDAVSSFITGNQGTSGGNFHIESGLLIHDIIPFGTDLPSVDGFTSPTDDGTSWFQFETGGISFNIWAGGVRFQILLPTP